MSDQGNIFLTWENLAFSLPLLTVVGAYLFFKYVPLYVAAALFAVGFGVVQIRQSLAARKEEKLQNLDESTIRDLVGDDNEADANVNGGNDKARKAKAKVQQRLAQERKAENRSKANSGKGAKRTGDDNNEDDVDEDDLLKFAKGSRQKAAATKSKKS